MRRTFRCVALDTYCLGDPAGRPYRGVGATRWVAHCFLLLLLVGKDFEKRSSIRPNFYVLSKVKDLNKLDVRRSLIIIIGLIGSIALSAFGILSLFSSLLILLGIMTVGKIIAFRELKNLVYDYRDKKEDEIKELNKRQKKKN